MSVAIALPSVVVSIPIDTRWVIRAAPAGWICNNIA